MSAGDHVPDPASTPVLVTGASRGIGAAIATAFCAAGHPVVGTATSADGAARIAAALAPHAGAGHGIELDVADAASVDAALAATVAHIGAPLVLVNNAGITRDDLIMRMKPEAWQAVMDTNLGGVYRMVRGCVRGMLKARTGRILNIGSVVARLGNPGQANYVAAKAGLEGLTRSLALELASRGITANTVAPGFIESDMTAALDDAQRTAIAERIPLGRMGAAEEVAALCLFLASPGAAYITGQTIGINGGMHLI